ncbi:unnamed protein product [Owenia fusiformis]|uniref:Uncharacterized protein n=1 Tax=Owenia fusiformis TaxID=6347 RepID=A0A8S4MZV9_OWEFU|nr:unnamed protein product [Owenia fusiformis]
MEKSWFIFIFCFITCALGSSYSSLRALKHAAVSTEGNVAPLLNLEKFKDASKKLENVFTVEPPVKSGYYLKQPNSRYRVPQEVGLTIRRELLSNPDKLERLKEKYKSRDKKWMDARNQKPENVSDACWSDWSKMNPADVLDMPPWAIESMYCYYYLLLKYDMKRNKTKVAWCFSNNAFYAFYQCLMRVANCLLVSCKEISISWVALTNVLISEITSRMMVQ